ncbi:MAG TPA: hypothetical protein VGJ20_37555, partial [Xanthobacteraceae bacterium]
MLIAGAWLYAKETDAIWIAIPQIAAIGGIVGGCVGFALGWILLSRRWKASPDFGKQVTVTLDEIGLHASV